MLFSEYRGPTGRPVQDRVVRNSAECKGCGDKVESTHRHDFRSCSCGSVQVDGGIDYLRRGFKSGGPGYLETSIVHVEELTNEQIERYHEEGYW